MKQTHAKSTAVRVATFVVAVIMLVMCLALTACNDKKTNDSNSDADGGIPNVLTENQLIGCIAFALEKDESIIELIRYSNMEPQSSYEREPSIAFSCVDFNSSLGFELGIFDSDDKAATSFENSIDRVPDGIVLTLNGNIIISENSKGSFDAITKTPLADGRLTQKQLSIIKKGFSDTTSYLAYLNKNTSGCIVKSCSYAQNIEHNYGLYEFYDVAEDPSGWLGEYEELKNEAEFIGINYTDDSYIDITDKKNAMLFDLTTKPGWHLGKDDEGNYCITELVNNGNYDMKHLIIPSQVGKFTVTKFQSTNSSLGLHKNEIEQIEVLTFEEGWTDVSTYYVFDGFDEYDVPLSIPLSVPLSPTHLTTIEIPSTLSKLTLTGNCPALTTIKYNGNKAELEPIIKDSYIDDDFEKQIHNITFKCNDGDYDWSDFDGLNG